MGRRVEQVAIEYIPIAEGIREAYMSEGPDHDPDPVTITVRPLTGGEYRARVAKVKVRSERGALADNKDKVYQKMLADCVSTVENYTFVDEDGIEHEITNGKELWVHGELSVMWEVIDAIPEFSHLAEGDKKKLSSQRGGGSAHTKADPSTGTPRALGTVSTAKTS